MGKVFVEEGDKGTRRKEGRGGDLSEGEGGKEGVWI